MESLVGEIAIGAISNAIQEAFTSMSYTVLGILYDELKIVMKDAGVLPCISNLTKIKFIIQQMKLGNGLQDPKFDRVWEDIKAFDKEIPFTVVAMAHKGSNCKSFCYVAVIPDSLLEHALNNPFLAAYAKSVLSFFTKIGDLESIGFDFANADNGNCLPFLRSGCKLKSLPDVKVYNIDDYSSKSKSLNANIWVNFWKYFFQKIGSTGDLACKLATNCQIHIPYETPSFVTGDLIELANEDHDLPQNADYWYVTAICNAHLGSAYSKGGVMGPMITYHDTVALEFPVKSPHPKETGNKMNILKLQNPTQDDEKTSTSQPEIKSPQIEMPPPQLLSPLTKNRAQHGNNRRRAPSPRRLRAGAASASPNLSENNDNSDDSDEKVSNDNPKPRKNEVTPHTKDIEQAFDKKSPRIPQEKVENVVEVAHIKVFTEKDFDSLKFDFTRSKTTELVGKSIEPCLLKVKLSTYGIGSISMEYNWHKKGMNLQNTLFGDARNPDFFLFTACSV